MKILELYLETSVWNFYFADDAPEKQAITKQLEVTNEVLNLAKKYLEEEVLPPKSFYDAIHAAVATVYELDALISWNLKHLASLKRMEQINGVNLKEGYSKKLELITPMEVADEI